jgi:hypothetical protein
MTTVWLRLDAIDQERGDNIISCRSMMSSVFLSPLLIALPPSETVIDGRSLSLPQQCNAITLNIELLTLDLIPNAPKRRSEETSVPID